MLSNDLESSPNLFNRRLLHQFLEENIAGGISSRTIQRYESAGQFPQRVRIHGRVYWRKDEVIAWLTATSQNTSQHQVDNAA